jgi:peptide-methionine (R)-S-oxide reductase
MFEAGGKAERSQRMIGRRVFFGACAAGVAGVVLWRYDRPSPALAERAPAGQPRMVKIVEFTNDGQRTGVKLVPMIQKSDAEWKRLLPPDSYEVTRHAATERAFTGALLNEHDKGVFRCICCDTALYNSDTKFESGTGWPSFWAPIAKENIVETNDSSLGMERIAVSCRRCDAHLGHVFDDGPQPTGLRYCMNSVALKFDKA